MPSVRVKGLDSPIEAEEGADLLSACRKQRVNLFWGPWAKLLNCRGVGLCTLCKVDILDGAENLAPKTPREKKRLKRKPDHWRLACQAKVQGDVTIDPYPLVRIDERVSQEALDLAQLPTEERREIKEEGYQAALETLDVPARIRKPLFARFRKAKDEGDPDAQPKKKRSGFGKKKEQDPDKEAERLAKEEGKAAKRRAKEAAKAAKKGKKGAKQEEEPVET